MNLSILPLHLLALTGRWHTLQRLQSESKACSPDGVPRSGWWIFQHLAGMGFDLRPSLLQRIFDSDVHFPRMMQQSDRSGGVRPMHLLSLRGFMNDYTHKDTLTFLYGQKMPAILIWFSLIICIRMALTSKGAVGKLSFFSPAVLHSPYDTNIQVDSLIWAENIMREHQENNTSVWHHWSPGKVPEYRADVARV